ncbi:MAG: hypothetical protein U1E51_14780 [Candidatus Binatia bacterium]|nr:hypothetical protein [Candidatus Binatia bacterium]
MNIVHRVMPGLILGTILSLASFSATASAAPVTITSISGWTAGNIVVSGRWTGQLQFSKPPVSNAYKDMLAVESQYNGNPAYTPESIFF